MKEMLNKIARVNFILVLLGLLCCRNSYAMVVPSALVAQGMWECTLLTRLEDAFEDLFFIENYERFIFAKQLVLHRARRHMLMPLVAETSRYFNSRQLHGIQVRAKASNFKRYLENFYKQHTGLTPGVKSVFDTLRHEIEQDCALHFPGEPLNGPVYELPCANAIVAQAVVSADSLAGDEDRRVLAQIIMPKQSFMHT